MDGKTSGWKQQCTRIRQGCPLSPYLFVILMTVIFHDIHENDQLKMTKQRIMGTQADEVLYADDTICMAQNERAMNRLLKAIEEEGASYGMKLNKGKCEMLGFGKIQQIKFREGSKVNRRPEAKYLGCVLNEKTILARIYKHVSPRATKSCKNCMLSSDMGTVHTRLS